MLYKRLLCGWIYFKILRLRTFCYLEETTENILVQVEKNYTVKGKLELLTSLYHFSLGSLRAFSALETYGARRIDYILEYSGIQT